MFKTITCKSMNSRQRALRVICFAAFALVASGRVQAGSGQSNLVLEPVASFSGTIDSVPIPPSLTGGVTGVETGPITLSLLHSEDVNPVFGLDNIQQSGEIDVTLVLSSPLFTMLGETPIIEIHETGPASVNQYDDYGDFNFHADLTGGGTVQNGLFAGTQFHNVNAYDGVGTLGSWDVQLGSAVSWNIENHGSVTFPDGTTVSGLGGGGQLMMSPEPSSWILLAIATAAIMQIARRRNRAGSREPGLSCEP
jgi:hypothetical protein